MDVPDSNTKWSNYSNSWMVPGHNYDSPDKVGLGPNPSEFETLRASSIVVGL